MGLASRHQTERSRQDATEGYPQSSPKIQVFCVRTPGQSLLNMECGAAEVEHESACHPAFLSLPRIEPFDFSARARLRATRLIMARFSGLFCLRFRARSSFMVTSSSQCRLFSMAQWARVTARQRNARLTVRCSADNSGAVWWFFLLSRVSQ